MQTVLGVGRRSVVIQDCPGDVVLPQVILLPAASPRMLPAVRPDGSEATYGGRSLTSPIGRCAACWRLACSYVKLL